MKKKIIKINIITSGSPKEFLRQIDNLKFTDVIFTFENIDLPIDTDLVVILHRSGLSIPVRFKRKFVPLLYISMEPDEDISEISVPFLEQFDYIWSSDNERLSEYDIIPTHTWWLGININFEKGNHVRVLNQNYDFDYFKHNYFDLPPSDRILIISSKKMYRSGHKKRVKLIEQLMSHPTICEKIDVYGYGFEHFNDKIELLKEYRFVIIIENECKPDYWTEKLADVILLNREFIYVGCENIEKYLPNISAYNFDDFNKIVDDIENKRFHKINDVLIAKNIVLEKYNIVNMISSFARSLKTDTLKQKKIIYPNVYLRSKGLKRLLHIIWGKLKK